MTMTELPRSGRTGRQGRQEPGWTLSPPESPRTLHHRHPLIYSKEVVILLPLLIRLIRVLILLLLLQ